MATASSRPAAFRAVAAAIPVVLWAAHFLALGLRFGLGWSPSLWGGVIVLASLSGLALSLLAVPPALPAHLRDRV